MTYKTIILERERHTAVLTLNRPEKRNALTREMLAEIESALRELDAGPERAVILTGGGKAFCSGMDLSVLREMNAEGSAALADSQRIADFFRSVYAFSKPLIAAINGHAVAGGCGLATLADVALAAPDASFGYPEARVGFMPAFVAAFLVAQIGERQARRLLLSGQLIHAEEARRLGIVDEVVPAESLMDRAREIAAGFAAASPTSVRMTKRLLEDFFRDDLSRKLDLAVQASAAIRAMPDFREGLAAFLEKRKPRWLEGGKD